MRIKPRNLGKFIEKILKILLIQTKEKALNLNSQFYSWKFYENFKIFPLNFFKFLGLMAAVLVKPLR